MKTPQSSDVIQGDDQSRDGHYRVKQDLREQDQPAAAELDPSDSVSLSAQNPVHMDNVRVGNASEKLQGFLRSGTPCSMELGTWGAQVV